MALCLHVGHGKTGSSALQSWFARNAAVLQRKHQVAYPQISPLSRTEETQARMQKFSMGNGFILHEILRSPQPEATLHALRNGLGPGAILLFSREAFVRELPGSINTLSRLARNSGLDELQILLFVRDPLPHAYSVYCEMVKAHGLTDTFTEWMPRYSLPAALECFLNVVRSTEGCGLTTYNYSRHPEAIVQQAARWLGISSALDQLQPSPEQLVNRSLCQDELQLMRLLNRSYGKHAAPIGRRLAELPAPPQASPWRVPLESQERFLDHIAPTVARVNAHLPMEAALKLQRLPSHYSCESPEPTAPALDDLRWMPKPLAALLTRLGGPQQADVQPVRDRP